MAAKKPAARKAKAPARSATRTKAAASKSRAVKKVVKKPATRASARKAAPVKKAAPAKKVTAIQNKYTKSQIVSEIADNTGLNKSQINDVLSELTTVIERHIKKRSVGEFTLPGLLKIKTVKKPARKARKGINPFTGEETMFKARPASTSVKVTALKALKDMAN
ncbi:MAG TPA: integration host factor [Porticoccaceae bacterium]|nr:integration host factor [Porticoccaceae bacterium]